MIFEGTGTALITPFDSNSKVNFSKFKQLINMQISAGVQALIINGTTGEATTLSEKEQQECLKRTIKTVHGRVPIIAGTGSNVTEHALDKTLQAQIARADAAMIVTPYYLKTSQAGLIEHYTYIANNVEIPILMYHVPGRTGQVMTAETVIELSKHPRIVGIKDATGDIEFAKKIRKNTDKDFAIYVGNDNQISLYMCDPTVRANGVISVVSNMFPEQTQQICTSDKKTATKLQKKILPVIDAVFEEPNPIGVKAGMNILGHGVGGHRRPLVEMADANQAQLELAINNYIKVK